MHQREKRREKAEDSISAIWYLISAIFNIWPVGQAVKTPASHAGFAGSIPARVTTSEDRGERAEDRSFASARFQFL